MPTLLDQVTKDIADAMRQKDQVSLGPLRMLKAGPAVLGKVDLKLRAVCSAGEALGRETWEWARAA